MTQFQGRFSVLPLLVGALITVAGLDPAAANQFRRINDANVSCSNNLTCDLYISNPRVTLATFTVRRRPAAEAEPTLVLTSREPFSTASAITILVDGRVVAQFGTDRLSYRAAVSEYLLSDIDIVTDVIAAAREGSELTVQYQARSGSSQSAFSLAGFPTALIYMDDVQGRTGRDERLSLIGVGAGSETGSAPALDGETQVINRSAQLPVALRQRVYTNRDAACRGAFVDELLLEAPAVRIGTPGGGLFVLPCTDEDADNQSFVLWSGSADGDAFAPVPVPVITDEGLSARLTLWNAQWDGDGLALTDVYRASSLGECGRYNRWTVTAGDDGPALLLAEARLKSDCDGTVAGGPQDWEPVWPQAARSDDG